MEDVYKTEENVRLEKLAKIRESGRNPYPAKYDKKNPVSDIQNKEDGTGLKTAGRIMTIREMGKITFLHLQDNNGRAQLALQQDKIGKDEYKFFLKNVDMGDFIGVEGEVFTTKKGEKTLLIDKYDFLGKALLPMPEKWHGLKDEESQYRHRYLDLLSNPETMERFQFRSRFIKLLREFYWQNGFTEVDTPVLANEASGALAKPFITHHNALDTDVYLRIAPETYLKKCVVGGYEKVFEVARCFRNEGMDPSHLQEFTMVEHYAAWWDYEKNMDFTEEMFGYILDNLMDGERKVKVPGRDGEMKEIDFSLPWKRVSFRDLLIEDTGIDIDKYKTVEELRDIIKEKKIEIDDMESLGRGNLIDALYKKVSRPKLINPTFLIKHPLDLSPLARRNDENPDIVDRFQLVINTWEVLNAYSELVDPVDQEKRFESQSEAKSGGDEEAHDTDDEYIEAMKYGMPPISGWGMGIERILALLAAQTNLRDVVLFPLLRPKGGSKVLTNSFDKKLDFGIDYKRAVEILDKYITNEKTRMHCRESEVVMRALARELGQDEEMWGIAGLLHDIDWDITKDNIQNHTVKAVDILRKESVGGDLVETVVSHTYGNGECGNNHDKSRNTPIQHCLAAGETVTGLIYATALMQPSKKLVDVKLSSLKKKMKDKRFAGNCDREIIRECEKAGIELDRFLELSLGAMGGIAKEIGLG